MPVLFDTASNGAHLFSANTISQAEVTRQQCPECTAARVGGDEAKVFMLKFKFRRSSLMPGFPTTYTGCVRGHDDTLTDYNNLGSSCCFVALMSTDCKSAFTLKFRCTWYQGLKLPKAEPAAQTKSAVAQVVGCKEALVVRRVVHNDINDQPATEILEVQECYRNRMLDVAPRQDLAGQTAAEGGELDNNTFLCC